MNIVGMEDFGAFPFLKNSFGELGYGGPCPPVGDQPHHYVFTLYALNIATVPVSPNDTPISVEDEILSHSIGSAVLTGRYGR